MGLITEQHGPVRQDAMHMTMRSCALSAERHMIYPEYAPGIHLLLGGCTVPICAQVCNPLQAVAVLLHLRRLGRWNATPVGARRPAIPQAEMQPPRESLLHASEVQNQSLHRKQPVVKCCSSSPGLLRVMNGALKGRVLWARVQGSVLLGLVSSPVHGTCDREIC